MHIQERCKEDGKMSEDFLAIANSKGYSVYCYTSIGPVLVEEPEYRNGVSYIAKRTEES